MPIPQVMELLHVVAEVFLVAAQEPIEKPTQAKH
jgi:hypothetical protein